MADQDQDRAVDTDYSGRPYRPSSAALTRASTQPFDAIVRKLPDGRMGIMWGQEWYVLGADGRPDLDQPVDLPGPSFDGP